MGRIGIMMYLVSLAIAPLTGWSQAWVIVVVGVVVTAYTYLGGIEGVIWTDVLQSIMLILGAIVCVGYILFNMPEGPSQVFTIANAHNKFSLGDWDFSLTKPTAWVVIMFSMVMNLHWFAVDQSFVQRYIVTKSDKAARNSVWFGVLLTVPVAALFCFIGTGLFSFYTAQPELLNLEGVISPANDSILPYFFAHQLPSGAVGFIVAAILAAAMSSIDSDLNAAATLFLCNIYKPYICLNQEVSDRESKNVLHIVSLLLGGLSILMAFWFASLESAIFDIWWKTTGIFTGGVLGLFLLGIISRKAKKPAAITAVVLGIAVILWMTISENWSGGMAAFKTPVHNLMISVVGTLVILFTGILITMFVQKKLKKA